MKMYQQIYQDILKSIESEEFKSGDFLPSESEMIQKYNVSKSPIRQALNKLENDGFIKKIQGKGSMITDRVNREDWINMSGFKKYYDSKWTHISAITTDIKVISSTEYASIFKSESKNVIFLERTRFLENKPIFYMHHYLNIDLPYDLFVENLTFTSMQQLLFEKLGIVLSSAEDQLEAILADKLLAEKLSVSEGTPILKGIRTSKDENDKIHNIDIFYTSTKDWKYNASFSYNTFL